MLVASECQPVNEDVHIPYQHQDWIPRFGSRFQLSANAYPRGCGDDLSKWTAAVHMDTWIQSLVRD